MSEHIGPLVALETLPVSLIASLIAITAVIVMEKSLPRKRDEYDITGPISPAGCETMAVHKYKASDYTILDNLLNPWWTWCATNLPKWLAPNCVTLLGWLFYIPCDIMMLYYSEGTFAPRPRWLYGLGAWAIFWYQTFDAMDGKQARALGVAGPLGQIVDHGCDAISTVLATVLTASAMRVEIDGNLLMAWCLLSTFYIANWAEKYTHVLMAAVSKYMGVTESQYFGLTIMLLPALFGADFWLTPLANIIGQHDAIFTTITNFTNMILKSFILPYLEHISVDSASYLQRKFVDYNLNYLPLGFVIVWIVGLSSLGLMFRCLCDVAHHICIDARQEALDNGEPEPTRGALIWRCFRAYLELIPFFTLLWAGTMWYNYSLPNPAIGKDYYGAFFYHTSMSVLGVSFLAVHIICQSIINSMSHQPNYIFQPTLFPLFGLIALDVIPTFTESKAPLLSPTLHFVVYVSIIAFCLCAQIRWALAVVQQIANLFGIYILKLGPKVPEAPVVKIREELAQRLVTKGTKQH